MKFSIYMPLAIVAGLFGCDDSPGPPPTPAPPVESWADFSGAPTKAVIGAYTCMGKAAGTASGGSLELNGYVRTLTDPGAKVPPPASTVEVFSAEGVSLAKGFADATKDGRVSVSVPVKPVGFEGYAVVAADGYLDWRLQSSRTITSTDISGWAWLTKQDEVTARAKTLGIPLEAGKGLLVGAVHDCDGFGAANAVVVVNGTLDNAVFYGEGFDLVGTRTFTSESGRFAVANLPPGKVTVKAFGRSKVGAKLELLSSMETAVQAGNMTAVDLAPRTAP